MYYCEKNIYVIQFLHKYNFYLKTAVWNFSFFHIFSLKICGIELCHFIPHDILESKTRFLYDLVMVNSNPVTYHYV